jgi:hypothetical protein
MKLHFHPDATGVTMKVWTGHMNDEATVKLWHRAFQLAASLYRFREEVRPMALNILREALGGVETMLRAQGEADRHDPSAPSKVRWSERHWLQLLVYIKSERYEKQREQVNDGAHLSEADMMIRFVKHLILITCRRNSFHVTLGLSRLLHSYSTPETMDIYTVVFQNPDQSTNKVDAYYRDRKKKLMEELQQRFGQFVRLDQVARGEKRFHAHEDSHHWVELVQRYLSWFTPWDTTCPLPDAFRPWDPIPDLQANQVNQIHALIHPPCFSRLIQSLGFDSPERRLTIPAFFLANHEGSGKTPPGGEPRLPELTPEEVVATQRALAGQAARRRQVVPQYLSVLVDGVERARLDLARSNRTRFEVEESAMLIELVARDADGDLLLATHILTPEDEATNLQPATFSAVLEGGQKISLIVSFSKDGASAVIDVLYQETSLVRAVAHTWRQLKHRASESLRWELVPDLRPAWALLLVMAMVAGLMLYAVLRTEPTEVGVTPPPPTIEQASPAPPTGEPKILPQPNEQAAEKQGRSDRPPEVAQGPRPPYGDVTREGREQAVKSLRDVRRVYVASFGDDAFSQAVRQKIKDRLHASGRFIIAEDPEKADAALTGSARRAGTAGVRVGQVELEFVNAAGDVIWPTARSGTEGKYQGSAEDVAVQAVKEWLDEIRTEK